MKRFLFAVAVVALMACTAVADQPTTGTPTAPAAPVITTAAPVVEYAPAQTQRRGLFGRLRNRNTTNYYSAPTMIAPATTPAPAGMPIPGTITPAPQPMPTVKPAAGITTGAVIQATGSLPPGQYTTTDGMIIQIGGTQPMAQPMTNTTERRGLFSRLRNR